jgi:DNA-binding transcriptional LysR family regulator
MSSVKSRRNDFCQKLDWNLFKIFSIIVESGGVTAAADLLGRKQPSVSLALKRLEDQLNVRLCERGPSGFELTNEGRALADTCSELKSLIGGVPDTIADTYNVVSGPVRIRMISNVVSRMFDDVLVAFHRKCPNAELIVDIASWSDVINSLLRQEIDIGVAPARSKRADLIYHPLLCEIHRPYCGRNFHLYGQKIQDPGALSTEPFTLTGADEPDELTDFRLKYGLGQKVAGISQHLEEARRLAILGVGICFFPEGYAEPDVAAGRLWPLLGKRNAPSMDIFIISNPNGPLHLSNLFFLDEFKALIGDAKQSEVSL